MLKQRAQAVRVREAIKQRGLLLHDAFQKFDYDRNGLLSLAEVYGALDWLEIPGVLPAEVIFFVRSISSEPHISYAQFMDVPRKRMARTSGSRQRRRGGIVVGPATHTSSGTRLARGRSWCRPRSRRRCSRTRWRRRAPTRPRVRVGRRAECRRCRRGSGAGCRPRASRSCRRCSRRRSPRSNGWRPSSSRPRPRRWRRRAGTSSSRCSARTSRGCASRGATSPDVPRPPPDLLGHLCLL